MSDDAAPTVIQTDAPAPDAAPVSDAPAPEAAAPVESTPESRQNEAVAKFKEAVESVSEKPTAEAAPAKVDAPTPAPTPKEDAQPAVDADPVAQQKAAATAAVDAEVKKLNDDLRASGHKGLTKAAEAQFRKLAERPKQEEVDKIVAPLKAQADRMNQWDTVIEQARASGEQIQTAMQYIAAYNSGDPALMSQAADLMFKEVAGMFKALGRELPGAVDPLAEHPDLKDAVEAGDVNRKFALETAQARALQARNAEQSQRTQEQQEYQFAETTAKNDLNQLGAQLYAADGAQYQAKYGSLIPAMKIIRETLHPSQWKSAVFRVYQELPYTPAAPAPVAAAPAARPPVSGVPVRPTGGNGAMRQAVPKDPVAAFKYGLEHMDQ